MNANDWREVDRDRLGKHLEHELRKRDMTRRDLVRGGVRLASGVGLGWLFAACSGQGEEEGPSPQPAQTGANFTGTLRVRGLADDLPGPIRAAADKALGFALRFDVAGTATSERKVLNEPDSFDVFSGRHYQYDRLWSSGAFRPLDRTKIPNWEQVSKLFKLGKIDPASVECTVGQGDAPVTKLYVDPERSGKWPASPETSGENEGVLVQWADLSKTPVVGIGDEPPWITGCPQSFGMDSMGYNGDVIYKEPGQVSWAELLNPAYRGRVALGGDPEIALQDAAAATRALGLMTFRSLGNMTKEEIDGLIKILLDLKKNGHFHSVWQTFEESVNLIASGEVILAPMPSSAVALLVVQGVNARFAAPPEGFRGWSGGQAIAAHVTDPAKLQACYDYINWGLSREPGAIMMRQGYYHALQETSRQFLEPEEWDYWIEGEPAAKDLPGITGQVGDIRKGAVRDGGAFIDRACRCSSWNSYPQEAEYLNQRWSEFWPD